MTEVTNSTSTPIDLARIEELLGPPPVLSSEHANSYKELLARLTDCLAPKDFVEQLLIKQLADSIWEVNRYRRHEVLAIERKTEKLREMDARRAKAITVNREVRGAAGNAPTELLVTLQEKVDNVIKDVDAIITPSADELEHARALEESMDYYERLDQLRTAAIASQMLALEALDRYRTRSGRGRRKDSPKILDAEFSDAQPDCNEAATPLVPTNGGQR